MIEGDMPAFPYHDTHNGVLFTQPGMTLRDYFAGKAMVGFMAAASHPDCIPFSFKKENVAKDSYAYADEMLKARTQKEK